MCGSRRSAIRRQLIALSGAGVDEVVVVLGHHAELIEPVVQAFPVTLVRNPNPDAGQVSSQRLGLAAPQSRPMPLPLKIVHDPAAARFQVRVKGSLAVCSYHRQGATLSVVQLGEE